MTDNELILVAQEHADTLTPTEVKRLAVLADKRINWAAYGKKRRSTIRLVLWLLVALTVVAVVGSLIVHDMRRQTRRVQSLKIEAAKQAKHALCLDFDNLQTHMQRMEKICHAVQD